MQSGKVVFVVVKCTDAGSIAGVFSSMDKASTYCSKHGFDSFIITEHTVDKE